MTGTIVCLARESRTGTIQSSDGTRLAFSAAGVLGEFDALAVGHPVSFDVERRQPVHTAVRVFREPLGEGAPGKPHGAFPDLRYTGFHQAAGVRSYRFDAAGSGRQAQHYVVKVDMALLAKHGVSIQDAPALCLQKLAADLKAVRGPLGHELDGDDLAAHVALRAEKAERRRLKHSSASRRGAPPPRPSN
ncbi:MAG: hypothetical protein IT159_04055 [Bryobacterales bacterium]|nr:hypothetical protein [Bryobacterales bacterium]